MKIETKFNEYGWKIVIKRFKDGIVTITQRSKDSSIHMAHKPMQLRLQSDDFLKLKKLIKEIK